MTGPPRAEGSHGHRIGPGIRGLHFFSCNYNIIFIVFVRLRGKSRRVWLPTLSCRWTCRRSVDMEITSCPQEVMSCSPLCLPVAVCLFSFLSPLTIGLLGILLLIQFLFSSFFSIEHVSYWSHAFVALRCVCTRRV